MPLNYLEGNNDNIYAIQNLGKTYSDAVLGMREAKMNQARLLKDAMRDAGRMNLEQNKFKLDQQMFKQQQINDVSLNAERGVRTQQMQGQMDEKKAEQEVRQRIARLAVQRGMNPDQLNDLVRDPKSAHQLLSDLQGTGAIPQGTGQPSVEAFMPKQMNPTGLQPIIANAFQGAQMGQASSTPSSAASVIDTGRRVEATERGQDIRSNDKMNTSEQFQDRLSEIIRHNMAMEASKRKPSIFQHQTSMADMPIPQREVPQQQTSSQSGPSVGQVYKGYRFKGGDPADKGNWEKAK